MTKSVPIDLIMMTSGSVEFGTSLRAAG